MDQGPKRGGGGFPGALEPRNFCCGARSPIISMPGALNIFCCGARSPKFVALEPGAGRTYRNLTHLQKFCLQTADHSNDMLSACKGAISRDFVDFCSKLNRL